MEQELEQLEGTVEDIIYENTDNGYTVFEVSGGGVMTNRILTSQILTNRAHLEQQILPELTMVQPLVLQVTTHPMVRTEQLLQHLQRLLMLIVQIRSLQMAR